MITHGPRSFVPLAVLLLLGALGGCGGSEDVVQIEEVRELPAGQARLPPEVGTAERFGLTGQSDPHRQMPAAPEPKWSWTTPKGWKQLPVPAGGMRLAGFRVAGNEQAECTVIILGGTGGGLAANVNRWRKQMGLEKVDEKAVAALPRKPLLGEKAVFVDLKGTYGGMTGPMGGGKEPLTDARMLGLVLGLRGKTLFVKMVGPAAVIAGEQERFDAFAGSLEVRAQAAKRPAPPSEETPARKSRLSWTLPEGWKALPGRRMREASFVPAGAQKTECYIIILKGRAGGVAANVNLWRQQMGQGPLAEADIAALERAPMLGVEGILVEVKGSFKGMSGESLNAAMLRGAIIERAADTVFVKMVGPESEVGPEKANFVALCKSFKE